MEAKHQVDKKAADKSPLDKMIVQKTEVGINSKKTRS